MPEHLDPEFVVTLRQLKPHQREVLEAAARRLDEHDAKYGSVPRNVMHDEAEYEVEQDGGDDWVLNMFLNQISPLLRPRFLDWALNDSWIGGVVDEISSGRMPEMGSVHAVQALLQRWIRRHVSDDGLTIRGNIGKGKGVGHVHIEIRRHASDDDSTIHGNIVDEDMHMVEHEAYVPPGSGFAVDEARYDVRDRSGKG